MVNSGRHTNIHHTHIPVHICHMYITSEQKQADPILLLSDLSTLHISRFVYCLMHVRSLSSSLLVFVVHSSSTMGCRSSIHSWGLLLLSRSQTKKKRCTDRRERGWWGEFKRGKKKGKKEKPKRERTKNIAIGSWVTLDSVLVVTLLWVVIMAMVVDDLSIEKNHALTLRLGYDVNFSR